MVSRWFHLPKLHTPAAGHERKVGWLELFYDLVYVATIIQLGTALSADVSFGRFVAFAGLMFPLWNAWTGFTFFNNRFIVDDIAHRGLVFLQMFGICALAVSVPSVLAGETAAFALCIAGVRLVLVIFYARAWRQVAEAREMTRRYTLGFGIGVVIWTVSAFFPAPWVYFVWALAMGVDLAVPLGLAARRLITRYPPDVLHMSERYGILTLIVLGESFVKVLSDLSDRGADASAIPMGVMCLVVICSLWWIYFDDVAGSRIRARPLAPIVWVYTHLPLAISITAVGVAVKKVVAFAPVAPAADKYRWLLCGSLALALLSVALIDSVTERRQAALSDRARVNVRVGSALVVLLLAPTGRFLPAWAFVLMVALLCAAQVLFDLSMAPEHDPHAAHHDAQHPFSERPAPAAPAGIGMVGQTQPSRPVRRDVSEAVHRNAPSELRRDFYFYLMEGSWKRLFAFLIFAYLLSNLVFAGLYLLEPGSIQNARPGSFVDAFYFSVQTMSTIGFGALSPGTAWGNTLVVIEAAFGLLGVALATGVMFAKASRPHGSILFSNVAVVTTLHGEPVLMFRVGNARGNEVVEANMRVVVLKQEQSPEGHSMRRFHDLRLERESSPLFQLTWTVIHRLDAASPLHGITAEDIDDRMVLIIASMTGFDSTYAQTIHARKMYYAENLRFGERLVDVVSTRDDGRLEVDYDRFHQTAPDGVEDRAA